MKFIEIGKICNTHGIKGDLKVQVYTDFVEDRFKSGSNIYIGEKHELEIVDSYRFHKGFGRLSDPFCERPFSKRILTAFPNVTSQERSSAAGRPACPTGCL